MSFPYSDTHIVYMVNPKYLATVTMGDLEHAHDEFLEKLEAWLAENMPDYFDVYLEGDRVEREA